MTCPTCGRKLLSQASARCNWCGETVPDADFQAHASAARVEYFAHIKAHDAASLLAIEGFLPNGPFPALQLPPVPIPHKIPSAEAPTTEQENAGERFRHLEL